MKKRFLKKLVILALPLLVIGLTIGCSEQGEAPVTPEKITDSPLLSISTPGVSDLMAVQLLHTDRLMKNPGVVGTAVGLNEQGKPAILVLLKDKSARNTVPEMIDGHPVSIRVTGEIKAVGKPPDTPGGGGDEADHKARQPRPIELGVSGGNAYDLANGYCCSGTLGALVIKGGTYYILSNTHVFAHDIASSSDDPDVSQIGDPINQPGLIDVSCQDNSDDYVGYLSSLQSYDHNVDCAIAEIIDGTVKTDGSILEIGVISSSTVDAFVGQNVKKSGRTTGLSRSTVDGLNATVDVGYDDECNGSSFTVTYTGQILIKNRASKFLAGGDSGSLMVEDVDTYPCAVGLLYAGSNSIAVANPIGDVLGYLGASMVGN